jgi:hypothetical protein
MTSEFTFRKYADARCVRRHHGARGLHVSNPLDQQIALGKHLAHGLLLFCNALRHAAKSNMKLVHARHVATQRPMEGWARHNGGRKRAHLHRATKRTGVRCSGVGVPVVV